MAGKLVCITRREITTMDDDEILRLQRTLRRRLFEGPCALSWRPGRELLAQLLLYLDDQQACWRITAEWLRDILDADRVDAGFGGYVIGPGRKRDYVVSAESQRTSEQLPSVAGHRFDANSPGIRSVWSGPGIAAISDVSQERSFDEELRTTLLSIGTSAKLALPISDFGRPIGMICADWKTSSPSWHGDVCQQVGELAKQALGPLFAGVATLTTDPSSPQRMAVSDLARTLDAAPSLWTLSLTLLTPAEVRVARLISTGLSYKEVARELDRSLSTVDHQLRSIREKLGVRSTARLIHLLSDHFEREGS